jgi:hypothetical protein
MVKFHSSTVGVWALGCTPCGAYVVHGLGTVALHCGAGSTPGVIGSSEGKEAPEYDTEPLYGGTEFSRKLRSSISE